MDAYACKRAAKTSAMRPVVTVCWAVAVGVTAVQGFRAEAIAGDHYRHGSLIYERETTTRGPVHGFSGAVRFGARNYWCDYRRIPNRQCVVTRSGGQRCRVTSWTLQQYCY
jgi:hypothetical protein